nr:hypothetical protein [Tanacetum cinerariifolium]
MPPKSNFGIYESKFTYGPKQSKTSESDAKTVNLDSCDSNSSVETLEYVPKPVVNKPKAVSESKVWYDDPIIEEYDSDSNNEHVTIPLKEHKKPSFAFVNTVEHVKTPRQTVKEQNTCTQNPKPNKRDRNSLMSKIIGLGYGFTKKACFGKSTGPRENRPVWNNVQRLNHQNKFVPTTVLMKTNDARQNFTSQAASTRTARKVNTTRPKVNEIRPRHNVYKSHLPIRRPFNRTTTPKVKFAQHNVNTTGDKSISAVRGKWETAIKASAGKGIVNSGCSKHMTRNKAYLVDYQDFNGSPVAFGGSKGQITSKACLIAKARVYESTKWHRRLGHKGKQHKASCKAKVVSSISQPLQLLHMDLFGPTSVRSINHKTYFLVITDDFSRFSWVFFLRTKDETSGILRDFIRQTKNQLNQNVKTIRCDNGTEFKNRDIIEFCGSKEIKREYSNARTPQQNRVAERKNRTLIEVTRTMLAYSFLPNTFWAKVVSTVCYDLNRILVTMPQNMTPYELLTDKIPIISYIRPFGCHVTILNTIDHLGKFIEKFDEGFLVGYSLSSKAFMPITVENKANHTAGLIETNNSVGTQDSFDVGNCKMEAEHAQEYYELKRLKRQEKEANDAAETLRKTLGQSTEDSLLQAGAARASSTNYDNAASTQLNTASTPTNQDDS